jgi:hypothetical protein
MKRLLIFILLLMTLGACSPPLNLNKTIQATNIYGSFIVSYSDKWVIDNTQLGRIVFSNDAQGLEAYLRDAPMSGELVAGGVFALPKGEGVDSLEAVLNIYQESFGVSFGNRETFTENSRSGISATGTRTFNNIAVDVGIAIADIGDAFGIVLYYTSPGKVMNPMATIRRMSATVIFTPLG